MDRRPGRPTAGSVDRLRSARHKAHSRSAFPASSPLLIGEIAFQKALVSSAYIKPVVEMPHHNVDEEMRADLEPILEARDRFGRVIGYPGVLMRYYAPSLVRHRFAGSECFLFLFDKPV